MGDAIDQFAKALATGRSRREAALGLFASGAAMLPWTSAARGKRKNKHPKNLKRYLEYCQSWCDDKFDGDETAIQDCVDAAKNGEGPCYSASSQGPGYFCTKVKHCHRHKYCCPALLAGDPVHEGACCPRGTDCAFINGTFAPKLCVH
jgi:hypothetical protein